MWIHRTGQEHKIETNTYQSSLRPHCPANRQMAPHIEPALGHRGLWAQTATIDWCEQNYELSYYIAEFWNTLSNLAFIIPQLIQYVALSRHKSVEPAFRNAFLSLVLVGIGSFCFHMTLARPMQMFDETSMIVVSLHGFYLLYIIKRPFINRKILATALICYGLVFLSLYVFLVDYPIFHHTTFGLLVYVSVGIGYQLKRIHGPYYKFWTVLILQHAAFVFWLIDKHFCDVLTKFRDHHVPTLLEPAFQFHALWHLLMGLGSHIFICGLIRLRAWTKYKEEFIIRYRWFGLWITLEKVDQNNSPLFSIEKKRERQLKLAMNLKNREYRVENVGNLDMNSNQVNNHVENLSNYSS